MRKLLVGLLIAGSLCLTFTPRTAVAGSGEVAAGIVGGLAVGTLFGAAVAGGPRYYQPAPVYVAPAPPPAPAYWYYCQSLRGYYPTVANCPEAWIAIPAR